MKPFLLPNYSELSQVLSKTSLKPRPSEMHGLICGMLCDPVKGLTAFEKAVKAEELTKLAHKELKNLYAISRKQLSDFLFEFQLVLPADVEELPVRAEALTSWCQGFLTGLQSVGIEIIKRTPSEMTEAINDIAEIAKMNYEEVVANEEDETAYTELVEFVRIAVILIYQDSKSDGESLSAPQLLLH